MAARAAPLRSVATRTMARAPHRLPYALEHHGRLPTSSAGLWLSRFSTSSTSPPSSANLRGPDKKVPSGSEWYRAIVAFNEAASIAAFSLVFGGFAFIHFSVKPALDRIEANMEAQRLAWVTMREEIKKGHERIRAILLSNEEESQIEASDVVGKFSEGQRITGIGTK